MSGRYQRHPTIDDLRQNLNPLQITLAHRNQSHPQSPRSSKPGESDILTLQKQDTLTLRLHISDRIRYLMELSLIYVPWAAIVRWLSIPAGKKDGLAGHEAAGFRSQKDGCTHHLIHMTGASHPVQLPHIGRPSLRIRIAAPGIAIGIDQAGSKRVAKYAF